MVSVWGFVVVGWFTSEPGFLDEMMLGGCWRRDVEGVEGREMSWVYGFGKTKDRSRFI